MTSVYKFIDKLKKHPVIAILGVIVFFASTVLLIVELREQFSDEIIVSPPSIKPLCDGDEHNQQIIVTNKADYPYFDVSLMAIVVSSDFSEDDFWIDPVIDPQLYSVGVNQIDFATVSLVSHAFNTNSSCSQIVIPSIGAKSSQSFIFRYAKRECNNLTEIKFFALSNANAPPLDIEREDKSTIKVNVTIGCDDGKGGEFRYWRRRGRGLIYNESLSGSMNAIS